jgi:hypothetical protein
MKHKQFFTNRVFYVKVLFILFFLSFIERANGQDRISNNVLVEKLGYTNPASSVIEHIKKSGTDYNLFEFDCSLDYKNIKSKYYIVSQQSDLIYFEKYYDSTKRKIELQGYYRLNYQSSEIGYCWKKDLVWNYFNENGVIVERKYYIKGTEKKLF